MAGNIKGITIEIGGETTKLQSALKGATDKGRETATELGKINNALKYDTDNLVLIAQKMDVLKDRVSATEEQLNTLKSAQEDVEKQFKNGDIGADEYRAFCREIEETENKLKNFKDQLKDTEKEFKDHSSVIGKVKDAYDDFKEKVEKLKNEHPKLTSALEKSTDAAKTLASGGLKAIAGAAAGSVAGIAAVSAGVIKATEEMFACAKETAATGDRIDKLSQQLSLSREGFQEWEYVLSQSGVEMESMTTGMKTMTNTLDDARKGTDTAVEKFDRLGISIKDLNGKSQDEVFATVISSLQKIEDETEKAALANDFFGKSGQNLLPLLNQSAESTQDLINKARDLGLVMSDEAVNASVNFTDSLDSLERTFGAVKNNITAEFLPGLTEVMDGITGLFTGDESAPMKIEKGVKSIANAFENVTSGLSEKIEPVFSAIAELMPTAFESIFGVIVEQLPTFIEMGGNILGALVSGIANNSDSLIESATQLIELFATSFGEEGTIGQLLAVGLTLISAVVSSIGDNAELMVDSALTMVTTLIDGLLNDDNAAKLLKGALDIVSAICIGLVENAPELIAGAAELIGVLVEEILQYDWWQVAKDIFSGLKSGFKNAFNNDNDGSNAGGIGYVPYNGYTSELHEGERVLTAAQNRNYNRQQHEKTAEQETMSRRLDALERAINQKTVNNINVTATGSARSVVRGLNFYIEEENTRQGVFDK